MLSNKEHPLSWQACEVSCQRSSGLADYCPRYRPVVWRYQLHAFSSTYIYRASAGIPCDTLLFVNSKALAMVWFPSNYSMPKVVLASAFHSLMEISGVCAVLVLCRVLEFLFVRTNGFYRSWRRIGESILCRSVWRRSDHNWCVPVVELTLINRNEAAGLGWRWKSIPKGSCRHVLVTAWCRWTAARFSRRGIRRL